MQAKRPIWHLCRGPDDLCILPRHLSRVGLATSQKTKVKHATDDVILERRIGVIIRAKFDVHAGRAQEKDCVCAPTIGTMLNINGVAAVQVRAAGDAKGIARPHRARRVNHVQAERLRVFAKAIDVGAAGKRSLDAEVLRLENEGVSHCREEYVIRTRARNVKREWRGAVREFYLSLVWAHSWVRSRRPREDGLGDFVSRAGSVGYLEMYACFLNGEGR
jgi:hypothetical protein